jgi:hypothetical protein
MVLETGKNSAKIGLRNAGIIGWPGIAFTADIAN